MVTASKTARADKRDRDVQKQRKKESLLNSDAEASRQKATPREFVPLDEPTGKWIVDILGDDSDLTSNEASDEESDNEECASSTTEDLELHMSSGGASDTECTTAANETQSLVGSDDLPLTTPAWGRTGQEDAWDELTKTEQRRVSLVERSPEILAEDVDEVLVFDFFFPHSEKRLLALVKMFKDNHFHGARLSAMGTRDVLEDFALEHFSSVLRPLPAKAVVEALVLILEGGTRGEAQQAHILAEQMRRESDMRRMRSLEAEVRKTNQEVCKAQMRRESDMSRMRSLQAEVRKQEQELCKTRQSMNTAVEAANTSERRRERSGQTSRVAIQEAMKEVAAQKVIAEQADAARKQAEHQKQQADSRAVEAEKGRELALKDSADSVRRMEEAMNEAAAHKVIAGQADAAKWQAIASKRHLSLVVKAAEARTTNTLKRMEEAIKKADAQKAIAEHSDSLRKQAELQERQAHARADAAEIDKQVVIKSAEATKLGFVRIEFEASPGRWNLYSTECNMQIVRSLLRGDSMCHLNTGCASYSIDLRNKVQQNIATDRTRSIRVSANVPFSWSIASEETLVTRLREGAQNLSFRNVAQELGSAACEEFSELLRQSVFHHHVTSHASTACTEFADNVRVVRAWRVENFSLYRSYSDFCHDMAGKHHIHKVGIAEIAPSIGQGLAELVNKFGPTRDAPASLNEVFLLHGTDNKSAEDIAVEGFDARLARAGYYGKGAYFGMQSCKCSQYTTRSTNTKRIIISRVALGNPHYASEVNRDMARPPTDPTTGMRFDSVIAQPGSMCGHIDQFQSHMEFVVFEKYQAYPEYILEFTVA